MRPRVNTLTLLSVMRCVKRERFHTGRLCVFKKSTQKRRRPHSI